MKLLDNINNALILESLIDVMIDKTIIEKMASDDVETEVDLKPITSDETPKERDNRTGKKKGVKPLDKQDFIDTQEIENPEQDFIDTEEIKPVFDEKQYQEKLKKLLILAYKTSYDNENRAKSKEAKSGYQTIMHLASTIYKNVNQIKGPEQLNQVLKHLENGRNRYIEVARSYQQFYNSLKNL